MAMKRNFLILALIIAGLTTIGCSPKPVESGVRLGQEFSLSIGQKAAITGETIEITFLKVLEDSRCPRGAQCIWEGRAISLVSVVSNNTTEIQLAEGGLTDHTNRQTFRDYQIDFHLLPYPEVGTEITADQYRLQLTVSKPN